MVNDSVRLNDPRLPLRFWAKLEEHPTGCWLWTAARSSAGGYGTFTVEGSTRRAHRVSYEALVGDIPESLVLDHLCRVTHCVNPDHLEPVTNRVNLLRGETRAAAQAAQTHCLRGHRFDEQNTTVDKRGRRDCNQCRRDRRARARLLANA